MKKIRYLIIGIAVALLIMGVGGFVFGQNMYFKNRWYPGTVINEFTVSAQTMEDTMDSIREYYDNYTLEILGRNNGRMVIEGSSIGYRMECSKELDSLFEKQHNDILLPWSISEELYIKEGISYNEDMLVKLINESELVCGSGDYEICSPVSAHIEYDKDKGAYTCVKETEGNVIVFSRFADIVKEALLKGKKQIDLTDEEEYPGVYESPEITDDNYQLTQELALRNNAALRFINWKMDDSTVETVAAEQISKWMKYNNGKISYDKKAIKIWLEKMCGKYNTLGKSRTIKSHTGKKITVSGGDYGWQLDYEKTYEQLMKALRKKIDVKKTDSYMEVQSKLHKKAITITLKPVYLNSAYKLSTGKKIKDWNTKNYIEVSLGEQMVYVFRKGKVVFSCKCISGLPGERHTSTGAYYIKEHRRNYTMVGEDYRTFVKCWVRITWTGIGFHPATWQPWSRWSKTLYMYKGSHGCINLMPLDAEKIYSMSQYKEAVFIHE